MSDLAERLRNASKICLNNLDVGQATALALAGVMMEAAARIAELEAAASSEPTRIRAAVEAERERAAGEPEKLAGLIERVAAGDNAAIILALHQIAAAIRRGE